YFSVLAVVLKTSNESPSTDEFNKVELSCLIESISTTNPRIEWKKITNNKPSYVYFDKKISGDLENRAVIREPATLVITNATRSDTAIYRCEVTAATDAKSFDEIVINLVVRGILTFFHPLLNSVLLFKKNHWKRQCWSHCFYP
ncbi:Junctional adhesion molecule 3B, partial [Ataeniobius toweri]|nr:Junctional adhesion molecule 3B [Ataeniobius toweri]